jgi:hypothetical protein
MDKRDAWKVAHERRNARFCMGAALIVIVPLAALALLLLIGLT